MSREIIYDQNGLTAFVSPYDANFIQSCNTGWGCGYLKATKDHPLYRCVKIENIDTEYSLYYSIGNQEITLLEFREEDGKEYVLLGFDTAHSWNSIDKNPREWVVAETMVMLEEASLMSETTVQIAKLRKLEELDNALSEI